MKSSRSLRRLVTLALISIVAPAAGRLGAQTRNAVDTVTSVTRDSLSNAPVAVSEAAAPAGAPLTGLRAGVHMRETARSARPNVAATNAHLGQSRAMMIVGGAALITGSIIGGDAGTLIMVGGAVIGLYGLYQYLQ